MKILAIGDFHGKFPLKLRRLVKKEGIDLVVSIGDYPPFSFRKIWFKHCYKTNTELWEVIVKKKHKELVLKDEEKGKKVLKMLNRLGAPVITISGNIYRSKWEEAVDGQDIKWKWLAQDFFTPFVKKLKNVRSFDYSYVCFRGIVFIGMARSTFPGRIKSKNYKKQRKMLDKLFKKFRKEIVVFVSHNVPYETKLDKICWKNTDKEAYGKHYGSKLVRRLIQKWQPIMNIAGHMHENQGRDKIGKSVIINTGAAQDGQAVIIEIDDKTKKIKKVRFVK